MTGAEIYNEIQEKYKPIMFDIIRSKGYDIFEYDNWYITNANINGAMGTRFLLFDIINKNDVCLISKSVNVTNVIRCIDRLPDINCEKIYYRNDVGEISRLKRDDSIELDIRRLFIAAILNNKSRNRAVKFDNDNVIIEWSERKIYTVDEAVKCAMRFVI